jgi:hypothetical protein
MHYYFLENQIFRSTEEYIYPNPIGLLRILQSEEINIEKHVFNSVHFNEIVFFVSYERKQQEFCINYDYTKFYNKNNSEIVFNGLSDLFKTHNFYNIFFSKKLAIDTTKNIMNNVIRQFAITFARKRQEISNEETRFD